MCEIQESLHCALRHMPHISSRPRHRFLISRSFKPPTELPKESPFPAKFPIEPLETESLEYGVNTSDREDP